MVQIVMAPPLILLVEDEDDIVELIRYNLVREGYRFETAASGEKGIELARKLSPDLIILDIMLPGIDGIEVCRALQRDPATEDIHILFLSAKGEEVDIVAGLELGADDYLSKPFSPRVLLARVRAHLRRERRNSQPKEESLRFGALEIHPGKFAVMLNGKNLQLTASEFKILHLMAQRPGWVFTRSQIVDGIHGNGWAVTDRAVDVQILGLRRKLGSAGSCVETVRGVGYRFSQEGTPTSASSATA